MTDSGTKWVSDCGRAELFRGDCLALMRSLPDCSIDAVVTDPPAGIAFMGRGWDTHSRDGFIAFMQERMSECLRLLKPGGHALVWAIPRTSHWTATACEDAGFEIRDRISHLFGSGFPKSMDVGKALDKAACAERNVVGIDPIRAAKLVNQMGQYETDAGWSAGSRCATITAPATEAAAQWNGWGTALKPACEDWWLCRKPLEGTVAANVTEWGTGALNIDGCRVAGMPRNPGFVNPESVGLLADHSNNRNLVGYVSPPARWPANIVHDGSDEVVAGFPSPHGAGHAREDPGGGEYQGTEGWGHIGIGQKGFRFGDSGSAARFFYCAKASRTDRGEGNKHPTVKPTRLMQWLCRLITPPNGLILDPFTGSGSTGKAALMEGFRFIGAEQEQESFETARRRIAEVSIENRERLFSEAGT